MKPSTASMCSGEGFSLPADWITLKNRHGLTARFTRYGARWVSMQTPDREGRMGDILLGFDTLDGYRTAGEAYHGAIIGRVCGRIRNARFRLGTREHVLASNDVYGSPIRNHLHGGIKAFHNRFWRSRKFFTGTGEEAVEFTCYSPDGEEGYPGNLEVKVTYLLGNDDILRMTCEAITDRPTPVNLTNHTFFNLQASAPTAGKKNVLSHLLTLNASAIIECDGHLVPTGRLIPVGSTLLDFRTPRTLASSLAEAHPQILKDKGFSLAYALDRKEGTELSFAARLSDEVSGRRVDIHTNQLSMQVYTGYFMDGRDRGKEDIPYFASAGLALEPQGYPDAPNQPSFPPIWIDKDTKYWHLTEYRFSCSKETASFPEVLRE